MKYNYFEIIFEIIYCLAGFWVHYNIVILSTYLLDLRSYHMSWLCQYFTKGAKQMIEYQSRNLHVADLTLSWTTPRNIEQLANLLCAKANSAS